VDGNLVGRGDIEAQVRQVYTNLSNITEEAGGRLQNIMKMSTFLTHYSYIEAFRSVRNEYFAEPFPPNTLLIVESLALPEFMVEVEAIAVLD
jgi:enamine deaminase RidA (YjgF/YER057c/UK114 family)